MKTKRTHKGLSIFCLLALCLFGFNASGQNIRPAGVNIGLVEENVFFSTLRTLIPNKDWSTVLNSDKTDAYYQLKLPYASMPDFDVENLELFRKGSKHHRTVLNAKGRMACELLLEECFDIFGELQYPSTESKSKLIFEWNVSENFAGQRVVYKLEDKKTCTITMQVNS